ncbi:MAG: hypothetical protein R3C30_08510 [Hyphomonadaceae bacterium]
MFGKRGTGEAPNATPTAPAAAPPVARVQAAAAPRPVAATPPAPTARPAAPAPRPAASGQAQRAPAPAAPPPPPQRDASENGEYRSEAYYRVKSTIFNALIETIDLTQLAQLDPESARDEIRDIVAEIISIKNVSSCRLGRRRPRSTTSATTSWATARRSRCSPAMTSPTSWSMYFNAVFIEVNGKISKTGNCFRDNGQLMNICQRIVSQVGRRVDESSPDMRRALA